MDGLRAVRLPADGTLVRWTVVPRTFVDAGQELGRFSTETSEVALTAPFHGYVAFLLFEAGQVGRAGQVAARIRPGSEAEDLDPVVSRSLHDTPLVFTLDELHALAAMVPSLHGPTLWEVVDPSFPLELGSWEEVRSPLVAAATRLPSLWVHGSDGVSLEVCRFPPDVRLVLDPETDDVLGLALRRAMLDLLVDIDAMTTARARWAKLHESAQVPFYTAIGVGLGAPALGHRGGGGPRPEEQWSLGHRLLPRDPDETHPSEVAWKLGKLLVWLALALALFLMRQSLGE
ncbi:MAG: hypothetical protein H6736_24770 [Alphaproteobacteria bacterium]|nr:hypothetical protein [Alphaproteobacteria bacterium]